MSSISAEYYQIKGMVSDMTAEEQAEVARVEAQVLELSKSSQAAALGVILASIKRDGDSAFRDVSFFFIMSSSGRSATRARQRIWSNLGSWNTSWT